MATPHVSGALALMLSVNGYDPTPDEAITGVTGADGMAIFNLDGLVVTPDIEDAKLVVIEP